MKKIVCLILALVLCLSCMVGCSKKEGKSSNSEEKGKLAFIAGDMSNESQVFAANKFTELGGKYGFEVTILDGRGDPQAQAQVVGNAVAQGADVICINPNDATGIVPSLESARKNGVIVGVYGSELITDDPNKARDFYVTQDDIQGGKLAVEILTKQFSNGCNVVEVEGQAGHDAAIKRHTGFTDNLKGTKINLLANMAPTQWATAEAMSIMEDMIVKYGEDIDAVFCHWDNGATGVIEALKAAQMNDVLVIGIDGCTAGYNQVKEGTQFATISLDAEKLVIGCLETAQKAFEKKPFESAGLVPFDLITKDNIDNFPVPQW